MARLITTLSHFYEHINDFLFSFFYKKSMKNCGKNVRIKPTTSAYLGLDNLSIGNDVIIPRYAHIYCTDAPLTIGNKVLFGPAPTIVTGDHRVDIVGKYIFDSLGKKKENDKEVIVEDDVWVGANVTILKGVTIGRGSVVSAGAVVHKSCPRYSIIGGIPAKFLKFRFTIHEIIEHEKILYTEEQRSKEEDLAKIRKEYRTA